MDVGNYELDYQLEAKAVINVTRYNVKAGARGYFTSNLVNP